MQLSMPDPMPRLRELCLALREGHEVIAWGEPTFRVRNKMFAMFANADNHHGGGRDAVWVKSTFESQDFLVRAAPARFFIPPYMGSSGWVGVYLNEETDWGELEDLLREGYYLVAPKRLKGVEKPKI